MSALAAHVDAALVACSAERGVRAPEPARWRVLFAEGSGFRIQGGAGILPGCRKRSCRRCLAAEAWRTEEPTTNGVFRRTGMSTTHARSRKRSAASLPGSGCVGILG